jgi:aspartate aminotransferase
MTVLSNRVLEMKESATLAMARQSRMLKEQGVDIISLSLGEPDFDTPDNIKRAAENALEHGDTKYTPVSGTKALRDAICRKLERENKVSYTAEQIVVSNGAKQSIANACMALLNPGDEIILPSPFWISYAAIAELAGAKVVEIKAGVDEGFKVSAEKLEQHITAKTKVILYSSPCNPTGAVFNKQELRAIADLMLKHPNIHVISDEIYEHINYLGEHYTIAQFEDVKDRVIIVNGFSKAYSMTGWRLGYMAASKEIASACDKIQGQITSGACSFNQTAAIEALDGNQVEVEKMVDAFKRRRALVINRLSKFEGVKCPSPDGAFYVFPDISCYFGKSYDGIVINNSEDFALFILNKAHVATVGGDSFGDGNCLRISFAASEEALNEAFDRIEKAVAGLVG